jgi:hypothetical protein
MYVSFPQILSSTTLRINFLETFQTHNPIHNNFTITLTSQGG